MLSGAIVWRGARQHFAWCRRCLLVTELRHFAQQRCLMLAPDKLLDKQHHGRVFERSQPLASLPCKALWNSIIMAGVDVIMVGPRVSGWSLSRFMLHWGGRSHGGPMDVLPTTDEVWADVIIVGPWMLCDDGWGGPWILCR